MWELLLTYSSWWVHVLAAAAVVIDVVASVHALLRKRDVRAAISWVAFIWFVPVLGGLLYLILGINRIRRKARSLRGGRSSPLLQPSMHAVADAQLSQLEQFSPLMPHLARAVNQVTQHPLLAGNDVTILTPATAYPCMLEAIHSAERSVALLTYIFDHDAAGRQFVQALSAAVQRGVAVRVLIDDIGSRYSWPSIIPLLRQENIPHAIFLPKLRPVSLAYANLCNHRKILVVDGRLGFTGGMNIRAGHAPQISARQPIEDLHFAVTGPVVSHLQYTFADDWHFTTGEMLEGDAWFPPLEPTGTMYSRGIPDGPDENYENLRLTLMAALSSAQRSVRIVTPYFLPDQALIWLLNVTALRGVDVDILLPQQNNLKLVQWACMAQLWQVLERGCRVWLTPPPFDHSKLMIVDGVWTLLGSSNWDPRSFRLNFEFNLECYDRQLAHELEKIVQAKIERAHPLTLREVDARPLPIKLRDGVARLLTPYL
ncbi:MAG: cardiolipin synthase [Planctomycetaceae bacterium]|nr:MAG: cardiolipin synthase [Planctomycetaceae bacterium]